MFKKIIFKIQSFFKRIYNKIKAFFQSNLFKKILSYAMSSEGILHIILSSIAFWGMISGHVYDLRIWINPTFDFFMGFIGITTGIVMHSMLKRKEKKDA